MTIRKDFPDQQLIMEQGKVMLTDGQRIITEVMCWLSAHLPENNRAPLLQLVRKLCEQSMLMGRVSQTIENLNILNQYYEQAEEKGESADSGQKKAQEQLSEFSDTVFYGYAETQGNI